MHVVQASRYIQSGIGGCTSYEGMLDNEEPEYCIWYPTPLGLQISSELANEMNNCGGFVLAFAGDPGLEIHALDWREVRLRV